MPAYQPRSRFEIVRDMVARVVARSKLVGLTRNSVVFHILAAAANEDAEQYFQMSRLRDVFNIDRATGSDLDERAKEILPGTLTRRLALAASGTVIFSRPGIVGTIVIPSGTIIAASDSAGQVKFRTTASGSILVASTVSAAIPVIAIEPGIRGNVDAAQITRFITRITGVTGVSNGAKYSNGLDRESDVNFRARLKAFIQSLSRGTKTALEAFAKTVLLSDGRRVVFAHVKEPVLPDGTVELFIDDGTGSIETFLSLFVGAPQVILDPALGGEVDIFTSQRPIRDDGSFIFQVDTLADPPSSGGGYVTLIRDTDYVLNAASGQITLLSTGSVPTLLAGYKARAEYRYYTGLIQETQRVIDGDPAAPLTRPGVRAAGILVYVRPPQIVFQTIDASISVGSAFDPTVVSTNVASAIQDYINNLDIGSDVIVSEIIERAMAVDGMFNFTITDLSGTVPPADQVILDSQAARITSASITLT